MAYDEPTLRRRESESADQTGLRDDSRLRLRRSPTYRTGGFSTGEYPADPDGGDARDQRGRGTPIANVFDDPQQGEAGRDQLTVHLIWETLLLVATATLAVLLYRADSAALHGGKLDDLLVQASSFGLLALGAGMTLRAAVPNLAVGPTAVIAAVYFAHQGKEGVMPSASVAVGVAAVAGLVLALFVVGFHVPAWAASLGAALGGITWLQQISGPIRVTGGFDPSNHAVPLFAGFAAVAVIIAALGSTKGVRRAIGRFRPVADPARRRGGLAALLATVAIVGSMILAALAGVLFASNSGPTVAYGPGTELTGVALGLALLGGTSIFGRRGGIFGTLLAAVLLAVFLSYDHARGWDISLYAIAAVMIGAGLIVTRAVEAYGRPEPLDWQESDEVGAEGWITATRPTTGDLATSSGLGRSSRTDSWSSALPAQPTSARSDAWDEDRWGTASR